MRFQIRISGKDDKVGSRYGYIMPLDPGVPEEIVTFWLGTNENILHKKVHTLDEAIIGLRRRVENEGYELMLEVEWKAKVFWKTTGLVQALCERMMQNPVEMHSATLGIFLAGNGTIERSLLRETRPERKIWTPEPAMAWFF